MLFVSRGGYPKGIVEGVESFRDRVHEGVVEAFTYYRESNEKDFEYWLQRERQSGAEAIMKAYVNYARRYAQTVAGEIDVLDFES